jgi:DNA-binding transcriptional LysR family regulator
MLSQIATLQAQLGTPLFERGARRLPPTPDARALADPAQRMLAAAQARALATDAVGSAAGDLIGTVRLTASRSTWRWCAPAWASAW